MKKLQLSSLSLACALLCAPMIADTTLGTSFSVAYASDKIATKQVPALRNKVYTQLARAQKMADEGDVAGAIAALDDVAQKKSSMNSYEIAMLHNFYGFIYYNDNQIPKAMQAFEAVVAQDPIPESLALNTLFSLAQIAMAQGQFDASLGYLDKWDSLNTKPLTASYFELKANAAYQNNDYSNALRNIDNAIALYRSENKAVKESWYILKRASHYSLSQPKQVVGVLETMVVEFDKPEYWLQLAAMYGEIEQQDKQLALLETAKLRGFVNDKNHLSQLAQVYMYAGVPFKAGKIMADAIDNKLIDASPKHFAFVGEAYMQARENEKAVPFFIAAAKNTETGIYDRRLAEVYLNLEMYHEAADAARSALDKGGLQFESEVYIALGMAQYNLTNFDAAILAFERAEKFKKSERLAQQWLQYVKREKLERDTLKQAYL